MPASPGTLPYLHQEGRSIKPVLKIYDLWHMYDWKWSKYSKSLPFDSIDQDNPHNSMKTVDNDLLTTYFRHNRMNKPTHHISMKGRYHLSVSRHYLRWLIVNFDLFVLNLLENQDHLNHFWRCSVLITNKIIGRALQYDCTVWMSALSLTLLVYWLNRSDITTIMKVIIFIIIFVAINN